MNKHLRGLFLSVLVLTFFYSQNLIAQTPPPQAAAAGYTRLAFSDDFSSISTIDMENTKTAGFNWYLDRPFGWATTPKDRISVSNGILTLTADAYGIGTICRSGSGSWIGFAPTGGAYFEASISFDPDGTGSSWPAVWSMAAEHLFGTVNKNFIEPDFFEYDIKKWKGINSYGGAVHLWQDVTCPTPWPQILNREEFPIIVPETTDWKQFNTVGTLWVPGVTIDYYFNNKVTTDKNPYSKYPDFKYGDTQHWPVILGASSTWPMKVDWVRVWVKDTVN